MTRLCMLALVVVGVFTGGSALALEGDVRLEIAQASEEPLRGENRPDTVQGPIDEGVAKPGDAGETLTEEPVQRPSLAPVEAPAAATSPDVSGTPAADAPKPPVASGAVDGSDAASETAKGAEPAEAKEGETEGAALPRGVDDDEGAADAATPAKKSTSDDADASSETAKPEVAVVTPAKPVTDGPSPPQPSDPKAAAAFKILEKHCSRCHQAGPKLIKAKPSKNFGNVMELDALSREPNFILPGNPDGSKLFIMIKKKEMPYDVEQEYSTKYPSVEDDELRAVYDWIASLGDTVTASCKDRKPIDEEAVLRAIARDLDDQQDHRRRGMRYITLTHLYNGCAPDADMTRFRQGVVKLLNSLSREADALRLRTIDEAKSIIAFNLDDLKWSEQDWERVLAVYPYGMKPDSTEYDSVARLTNTALPWLRGDWFAFTVSRPPLYFDLLKLPATFQELATLLGLDVTKNIEKFQVERAGFQKSGVSKHNRLIERHTTPLGYFWTSYDFGGDKSPQSLFVRPLGPGGNDGFQPDGGETIFSIPNGFQAYYLNKADGTRLDKGPTEIVLDDSQRDRSVTNAISCFGCHNQGIRKATDDVRKHVLADRSFPKTVRDQVEALYPPIEDMTKTMDEDFTRFRNAMLRAGLDVSLEEAGVETINFLSRQYEKEVDLRIAAAEFGLDAATLADHLSGQGGEAFRLKRRLEQGSVPREQIESSFKDLIVLVSDNEPLDLTAAGVIAAEVAKVGGKTKEETHDFDLSLISDRSDYKVNDLPIFSVRSKEDCNLTLINVDASGEGVVIFPNKFQPDNAIKAGKDFQFPGDDAPFQFRLKDKGTETVIAICNADGKGADGIKHNFRTAEFTELGNYRKFVTRQIVVEGKGKDGTKPEPGPGKSLSPTGPVVASAKPSNLEITARRAIKIEVR